MRKLVILLVTIPLVVGVMSGIYTRKIAELPEYPLDILEEKAFETLEYSPPELAGMIPVLITIEEPKEEPEKEPTPEPTFEKYDIPLSEDLQKYVIVQSETVGLDPKLVLAVMKVESNFKSNLISKTNDYGLMQINKVNHKWLKKELGITDFLDPKQSIDCGIHMLADIATRHNDEHRILTAYNWGEYGKFKTWKKRKSPTSAYSRKVLAEMAKLKGGS